MESNHTLNLLIYTECVTFVARAQKRNFIDKTIINRILLNCLMGGC